MIALNSPKVAFFLLYYTRMEDLLVFISIPHTVLIEMNCLTELNIAIELILFIVNLYYYSKILINFCAYMNDQIESV